MEREGQSRIAQLWYNYRHQILLVSLSIGLLFFLFWMPKTAQAALWAALWRQRLLVGMICAFAIIAVSLVWSAGQRFDTWIFLFLNLHGYHAAWLDNIIWQVTQLGSMVAAFFLAGLFFALHYRSLAMEITLGTITLWLAVEMVKLLTHRDRPFLAVEGTRIVGWRERGGSFPSGHTTQMFFLMTLLAHRFQLDATGSILLYSFAVLIAFTRIYVGVHYPRDVIAGAILGSAWGALATLVDPYWLGLRF